jgi:hypothetical protein
MVKPTQDWQGEHASYPLDVARIGASFLSDRRVLVVIFLERVETFAKDHILPRSTAQNIELAAKNDDFGLQCRPRPEQTGCSAPHEPEELAH